MTGTTSEIKDRTNDSKLTPFSGEVLDRPCTNLRVEKGVFEIKQVDTLRRIPEQSDKKRHRRIGLLEVKS